MYTVLELQYTNGVLSVLHTEKQTLAEAENQYHTILAAAALSSVNIHSAIILDSSGYQIKRESFSHEMDQYNDQ